MIWYRTERRTDNAKHNTPIETFISAGNNNDTQLVFSDALPGKLILVKIHERVTLNAVAGQNVLNTFTT